MHSSTKCGEKQRKAWMISLQIGVASVCAVWDIFGLCHPCIYMWSRKVCVVWKVFSLVNFQVVQTNSFPAQEVAAQGRRMPRPRCKMLKTQTQGCYYNTGYSKFASWRPRNGTTWFFQVMTISEDNLSSFAGIQNSQNLDRNLLLLHDSIVVRFPFDSPKMAPQFFYRW